MWEVLARSLKIGYQLPKVKVCFCGGDTKFPDFVHITGNTFTDQSCEKTIKVQDKKGYSYHTD